MENNKMDILSNLKQRKDDLIDKLAYATSYFGDDDITEHSIKMIKLQAQTELLDELINELGGYND